MTRVLAIDYGEARIGLAVSDCLKITAQGIDTINNEEMQASVAKILEVIKSYDKNGAIDKIVVGMPRHMNGNMSQSGEHVKLFIEALENQLKEEKMNIQIATFDERLTTVMAHKTMKELNISQKNKKQYADKLAATYILEDYLKYIE